MASEKFGKHLFKTKIYIYSDPSCKTRSKADVLRFHGVIEKIC